MNNRLTARGMRLVDMFPTSRNFAEKKAFMQGQFLADNSNHTGYPDFEFLHLPEDLKGSHSQMLRDKITDFFND